MTEQFSLKNSENSSYRYQLPLKVVLIVTVIILSCVVVLNVFFIEKLAGPELNQIYASGEAASIITSELALASMYSRKQAYVANALSSLFGLSENQSEHILQISVILVPNGIYYASTNRGFQNKKVHPSLLQKIERNKNNATTIDKVNYKIDNKTTTVLQFLRNIYVKKDGKEIRIATTQVLYSYKNIIEKTRYRLIIFGILNIVGAFLVIWIVFWPISRGHHKLIEALKQVKEKNLDYRLQPKSKDEIGILFFAYNEMVTSIKEAILNKSKTSSNILQDYFKGSSKRSGDLVLRKTEITCMCTRIPEIQEKIKDQESDAISNYMDSYLNLLEKSIQSNGGQIVKIIGDKTFVLFEGINSVDNAVRAALKCHMDWLQQNHERKVHEKPLLDFGIGLHSAHGAAGTVTASLENFTVVGEAASLAEYLCSCANREEIIISSSMMEKTNNSYQHQPISELDQNHIFNEEAFLLIGGTLEESLNAKYNQNDFEHKLKGEKDDSSEEYKASIGNRSYDSSIPDILEETLSSTPLELVKDDVNDNTGLVQGVGEHSFKDGDTIEFDDYPSEEDATEGANSGSLWDKLDSEVTTEED